MKEDDVIKINIVGCGKLGKTLAKLWAQAGVVKVGGVVNASYQSALGAVQFIGAGRAYEEFDALPNADIVMIATPDANIAKVAAALKVGEGSIVFHCSGCLSSDILQPLKDRGAYVASVHPVRSFANPQLAVEHFVPTYCTFEGDDEALSEIHTLFEEIGGKLIKINPQSKPRYHMASIIANNYLVTLHYYAYQNFISAGIQADLAKQLTANLMVNALENLAELPHHEALTGPIQRKDQATIEKHIDLLANDPILREVYQTLAAATVAMLGGAR